MPRAASQDSISVLTLLNSLQKEKELFALKPALDATLLQMNICSQSKGVLQWSRVLEEDVIKEAESYETPLVVAERSKLCRHIHVYTCQQFLC